MFAVLGGVDFLSYGLYIAAVVFQQLARTHYIEALKPDQVVDAHLMFWLSYALFAYASYWLVRSFLQLAVRQPRFDGALHALALTIAALSVGAVWEPPFLAVAIEVLSLAALSLFIIAALRAYLAGLRTARFFLIALLGLALGAVASVVWAAAGTNLPTWAAPLGFGFEVGTVFQSLTLALGLADRIAAANEERDRTQRHPIEEMSSLNIAYARFVPRTFLELLGKDDIRQVELGDQIEAEMTVLFSDVRSFTRLSEQMSPADTFAFLNGYLSRTGPLVRQHNGIIDKYIGDAIMALFPVAPDDALAAGIALQQEVAKHNAVRKERGRAPFAVGVGLHTGRLMLGTIGEKERMDGTVIADAVNLASRIEGLTKTYRAKILMSDAMRAELLTQDAHEARFLGRVAVKGKSEGIGLFEVLDADPSEQRELKHATGIDFQAAVAAFMTGDFTRAGAIFESVLAQNPHDGAAEYLRARCIELAAAGIAWTGLDHITTK